ncbi:MAG: (deoxy)nucleoside triphosphate pyrophosphohydrolase [Ignavibacteriales bacterium]|nr:(deoxy)nucleoside triphosphate pyrophosphohydrolase [Ignavibacteriaceae bacterium]QOJ27856.1 MAG: (deoxy)nucleoside triphosphate pyrophosphohydrolase [Ignavibacteriales bacterium]
MNSSSVKHLVACALIEKEGRILLAQRKEGMKLGLKWEFPGGKLEEGESVEECIVREIKEELNLDIAVLYRMKENYHSYEYAGIHLFPCVCVVTGGELLLRDHAEVRWITPEEIFSYDLAEADIPVARAYLDRNEM